MIRFAITMLGRGQWTGGEIYLRNMLTVIRDHAADALHPVLFLTPDEAAKHGGGLVGLLSQAPVVADEVAAFGRGSGLRAALTTGRDRAAAAMFAAHGCNAVFEPALFYGWRFPLPALAWMPDFQHRHLPEMFSRSGWLRREAGFRAQIATGRTVMLSSATARDDVERFYPAARGHTAVVRFAQAVDIAGLVAARGALEQRYDLTSRFVFLPNQFWKHKNHVLVADALGEAQRRGVLAQVPPIIMSGRQDDLRNPDAYAKFQQRLAQCGAAGHVRHLGLIPYRDVLGLVAAADAMLNPSRFEGWSTTVEEAKALGTPLVISDLVIHREQAPGARFFDPRDPAALLDHLLDLGRSPPRRPASVGHLVEQQEARLKAYALALEAAFADTVSRNRRHRSI